MSTSVDLNAVRALVLRNQQQNDELPVRQQDKLLVDRNGILQQGSQISPSDSRPMSEVPQGTFYMSLREAREAETVRHCLPLNTRRLVVGGTPGYLYSFRSEVGDPYTMFLYFDGSQYLVKLVSPAVEGNYGAHDAHLYADGTLCLSSTQGGTTLQGTYAKSVLWANGFSLLQRTGRFPFSVNNQ